MTGLYGTSGVNGAPSLPYAFGETNAPSYGKVVSSLVLNPGSYAGNTSTPFGASARLSGYYVCSPVDTTGLGGASTNTGLVNYGTNSNYNSAPRSLAFRAWESQDAVLIHIFCPEVGFGSLLLYGGWLKPDPSVATASDAESDGLIYGVSSSGNMGYAGAKALDIHNGGGFLSNTSDSTRSWPFAQSHTGILVPGGGFSTLSRVGAYGSSLPTLVTSSQKLIKFPMYFVTNSAFIGMAREMWMFRESVNGLVLRSGGSGGTDVGWIASAHNSTASDAILLSI
jgi:hypothetical protein